MSDGSFDPGARFVFAAQRGGGFRSDARFTSASAGLPASAAAPSAAPHSESEDPLTIAFAEGFAAGAADAQARLAQRAGADALASEGLALSFARLDAVLEEQLRQRLRDTVAALCEAAIAPLALDEDALIRRVERAVAMLARADDERLIRLHPDDIALLAPRFAADWQVVPDAALERGALRVETQTGGVEDGPDLWRRAIAEALHQC
jgi:flagellar assembly protein FliH